MKKLLLGIFMFFMPLLFVNANSIKDISMDIYIDQYGDATITETWDSYVDQGTEGYHPYFNIGNSSIELISASMDGNPYQIEDFWYVNASLDYKAYKAGIYKTGNEVDICFGLTSYGAHKYQVVYKIDSFVLKASDADIVYWTLFPYDFNATPNNVYIKIYSDFKYEDSLDVWGYGNYGGTAYVYDGYIEMNSPDGFNKDQYMTVLIKFPKDSFNNQNISDNNFEYYYNMAQKGATRYKEEEYETPLIFRVFAVLFGLLEFVLPVGLVVLFAGTQKTELYSFGATGNKVKKDVPFFRDIPCNKDIFRAYFVAQKYNLSKKKEDFLGAILLDWLRKGYVRVEKVEKKVLFKETTLSNIIFVNKPTENEYVIKLYDWMYEASKDGKLEENEFKKWCSSNYSKMLDWFDDIVEYEKDELVKENKITVQSNNKKFFNKTTYIVDPSMMQEAEQMLGLKKFLEEFSRIDTREPIEVNLWDEYLIYAQIFGIADEVSKQFKKLYPDIVTQMEQSGFSYSDIVFIHTISNSGVSSARSARSRAQSYSSGGGGFSSGGGGGGSFGGGGGGGGFR